MRALGIVHQRDAGPGVFADAFASRGVALDLWHIAETGSPPAEPAGYDAVLSFGGGMHAPQEDRHPWLAAEKALLRDLLARELPLLCVCLGAQLLSEAAGGEPRRLAEPEIGWFRVETTDAGCEDPVVGPLAPGFEALEWHSYECGVPGDARVLACTPACAQAFRVGPSAWGIQFHAEVTGADFDSWIVHYEADPDAVAAGLDPDRLRSEVEPRIEAWNELGRALCGRFVDAVAGGLSRPGRA